MDTRDASPVVGALYRAVWRWHFGAGLLAMPFLLLLAITGAAYLFKPELDHAIYRDMIDVPVHSGQGLPIGALIQRVESHIDGRVLQIVPPAQPGRAVRLMVRVASGEVRTAFADPYDGHVTGLTDYGGLLQLVRKIHSLQKFGFWASCLIELTAGWTIALVATGIFLWWPRGRATGGIVTIRGTPGRRVFWRDLHAVTGLLAAVVILFLAITGMPWSMFWGDHVQSWATAARLSEPPPPVHVVPEWMMAATMPNMPHAPHAQDGAPKPELPWAMEKAAAPGSHPVAGAAPLGLDRVLAILRDAGMASSSSLALPDGPDGAYVASWRPDRVEDTRVVYLDQYTGHILGDVRFRDWGPVGKAIEWGVAVHQGQEYGAGNRYLMLSGCVAIVLLAATSIIMYWKRRPKGSLGLPPAPADSRAAWGVIAILGIVGVIFPLVGASIVATLLVQALASGRADARPIA